MWTSGGLRELSCCGEGVRAVIRVSGLAEALSALRDADVEKVMATVLAEQAESLAGAVREALGTPPGGDHVQPWVQTGALQGSISYGVEGLRAAVGSNDPAAAPQELGTVQVPPRPFLSPAAAAAAPEIAAMVGLAVAGRLRPG